MADLLKREVRFICPDCGPADLIQILGNIKVEETIKYILTRSGFINLEGNEESIDYDNSMVEGYACSLCGTRLVDEIGQEIKWGSDLLDYLEQHKMLGP